MDMLLLWLFTAVVVGWPVLAFLANAVLFVLGIAFVFCAVGDHEKQEADRKRLEHERHQEMLDALREKR